MFDKKDPVKMALMTLFVSFIFILSILYLAKPSWVQIINQNTGKTLISWQLIVSYSVTFSLVISIATLLIISNKRKHKPMITYDVNSSFPPSAMASAYCGTNKH